MAMTMLQFLRPLGAPRPSSIQRLLRSTTTSHSPSPSPSISSSFHRPLSTVTSTPIETPSSTIPATPSSTSTPIPQTATASGETKPRPKEPYFVQRSASNHLPVYQNFKSGGNLRITRVRKIHGNVLALKTALEKELGLDPETVSVTKTQHLYIKVGSSSSSSSSLSPSTLAKAVSAEQERLGTV
ncbi:MAG: hypothetical protein M4579_003600 [Chaenotheca gracillima]|nr:MAG: hypothetical protein M4579_003600 [Chaenotheca gracillima]